MEHEKELMRGAGCGETRNVPWGVHAVALVVTLIWSTTFVSTKVLLNSGLTPESVFCYRFALAYAVMVFLAPRRIWSRSLRDEAMLLLCGLTGGSLYFLTENTALRFTYASNVAIIISVTPLLTMGLSAVVFRQRLKAVMWLGSLLALAGVTLVVLRGEDGVQVSPVGDMLTFAAAFSWALYSILLKVMSGRGYGTMFVTRKVFGYGLATMMMYLPFTEHPFDFGLLVQPVVWGNVLYLGLLASLFCFVAWNRILPVLGPDKANTYIYLNPISAVATAVLVLGEPVGWMVFAGAGIAIAGVLLVERTR